MYQLLRKSTAFNYTSGPCEIETSFCLIQQIKLLRSSFISNHPTETPHPYTQGKTPGSINPINTSITQTLLLGSNQSKNRYSVWIWQIQTHPSIRRTKATIFPVHFRFKSSPKGHNHKKMQSKNAPVSSRLRRGSSQSVALYALHGTASKYPFHVFLHWEKPRS